MIDVKSFFEQLLEINIDFFAGVPDSLLKNICAYITANSPATKHIITANEGAAIALGTGYHLATGRIPLIYMQNSGIGNAVNPLMSLADKEVYSIPMLLMIGWRGEPGVKDEPQHIKQGRVTTAMLDSMEIPYFTLDENSDYKKIIKDCARIALESSAPVALLVRKNAFSSFSLKSELGIESELTREQALEKILSFFPEGSVIVSTTGMLSRELYELREKHNQSHRSDFLTVGSMGHTSQIAMGIALAKPDRQVYCLDGDGSAIMHLGSYAIAGSLNFRNLKFIVFNNGAHDSVGGQPTIGNFLDFPKVTNAVGLKSFNSVRTGSQIEQIMPSFINAGHSSFLEIRIRKGSRQDLGRPSTSPIQNKQIFQEYLLNH